MIHSDAVAWSPTPQKERYGSTDHVHLFSWHHQQVFNWQKLWILHRCQQTTLHFPYPLYIINLILTNSMWQQRKYYYCGGNRREATDQPTTSSIISCCHQQMLNWHQVWIPTSYRTSSMSVIHNHCIEAI